MFKNTYHEILSTRKLKDQIYSVHPSPNPMSQEEDRAVLAIGSISRHLIKAVEREINIARIAKRCPENIILVVKCVELLFPKVLRMFLFF